MNRLNRLISFSLGVFVTLCMLIASERRAYAYVDPGSGLIALQTFASVAAAYAYFVRRRIQDFFTRRKQGSGVVLPVASKAVDSGEAA